MLTEADKAFLFDAMTLLEIANDRPPQVDQFFSRYVSGDLAWASHDLVQNVYSGGEVPLEKETQEVLATLEAARKYMSLGGRLPKPGFKDPDKSAEGAKRLSLLHRAFKLFKAGSTPTA